MIIRSQNGRMLVNSSALSDILIDASGAVLCRYLGGGAETMTLGVYSSREEARQVLDLLEAALVNRFSFRMPETADSAE